MKSFLIVVCFAIISFSLAEEYTNRYDNINTEEVLQNKRLLTSYMKCVLGQGRCTPEGKFLKVHLQDGMQTGCSKCTATQKVKARKVVNYIRKNEQQFWEDFKKTFDPEGKYKETYEAFLASEDEEKK